MLDLIIVGLNVALIAHLSSVIYVFTQDVRVFMVWVMHQWAWQIHILELPLICFTPLLNHSSLWEWLLSDQRWDMSATHPQSLYDSIYWYFTSKAMGSGLFFVCFFFLGSARKCERIGSECECALLYAPKYEHLSCAFIISRRQKTV